jgi:hypothetical protein
MMDVIHRMDDHEKLRDGKRRLVIESRGVAALRLSSFGHVGLECREKILIDRPYQNDFRLLICASPFLSGDLHQSPECLVRHV